MRRTSLMVAAFVLTIVGLYGVAASASATFHLMKIREVSVATPPGGNPTQPSGTGATKEKKECKKRK